MDLLLFGIQGSGKGTQGEKIAQKYNYIIFETGAELRKLSKENSELGQKIKSIIEAGHLVPAEIVLEIVIDFLARLKTNDRILFDGIPRSLEQAKGFNKILTEKNRDFRIISIDLSQEEAQKRLLGRRICKNCKKVYPLGYTAKNCEKCGGELVLRSDDNLEAIKNRLEAFKKETLPIIDDYEKEGKVIKINGDKSIEEVEKEIDQAISKFI